MKAPKSKASRRTIQRPAFVIDALVDHQSAMLAEGHISVAVFCTRTGQYLSRSNLAA